MSLPSISAAVQNCQKPCCCAKCQASSELFLLGNLCKHGFCRDCVNAFQETAKSICVQLCPFCYNVLSVKSPEPFRVINEIRTHLQVIEETIQNCNPSQLVGELRNAFAPDRALRTTEEFCASQRPAV
ncbi:hypothetical protein AAVH_00594 [Aphelenchoides avenae]|nr:hypothetical protein AAVH_00594 [Aphelenchus avenae]